MATPKKRIANSLTLSINTGTTTSYTSLGNIVKMLSGPGAKAEVIKLDLLGDVYDSKTRGSIDPGQVKFGLCYDPTDPDTTILAASLGAAYSTLAVTVPSFRITFPAIGTTTAFSETFTAFVAGYERTGEKNNMVTADITLEVSGDPAFPTS